MFKLFWGLGKQLKPNASQLYLLLEGSWDLVTTYNWPYNFTYI